MRKNERRLKELATQSETDHKSQQRLQEQVLKLEGKLKQCKRQIEESEEIASVNLAKYKKVQSAYDDMAENTLKSSFLRANVSVSRGASPGLEAVRSLTSGFKFYQIEYIKAGKKNRCSVLIGFVAVLKLFFIINVAIEF